MAGLSEPRLGPARPADDDRITWIVIAALTLTVIGAVAIVLFRSVAPGRAPAASILPTVNALLNGTSAVLLTIGYACIRRRNVAAHQTCMVTAFVVSTLFLITYLVHHAQVGTVRFLGPAWLKAVYLAILIPHVVLSAVVVPLALVTLTHAWRGRFDRHRRIARWTLPIWLFVSVSGVVVYWMLYHLGR